MKQIGDVMKYAQVKRESGMVRDVSKTEIDDKTLFFLAEKVVSALYGVRGRENVIPRYFRDGKLHFACHSPLWANELWMTRDTFRERLNREIGRDLVKEIKTSN
jgi:hypothetical protein